MITCSAFRRLLSAVLPILPLNPLLLESSAEETDSLWKKHVVHEGFHTNTAVAADFSGDGRIDIIANSDQKTRLFLAPDWQEIVLDATPGHDFIHAEALDVDGDGDPDFIGARYQPGLLVWLERPSSPLTDPWPLHVVCRELNGIHGLLQGDVDGDGRADLLANSAQPVDTPHPESLAWFRLPRQAVEGETWTPHIFARGDAPGLTHYLGLGDVNGDGRADACTGAKGMPSDAGDWFAWWEAPADPTEPWRKHLIARDQTGATNIFPVDLNGDGRCDFLASRGHGRGVIWFEAPHWTEHVIHAEIQEPHSLIVADLDNDGDIDGAVCAYGSREAWWFENDGKGAFTNHRIAVGQAAYDLRAVDLEGDGDLDLLIAGQFSKNVVWLENPLKPD